MLTCRYDIGVYVYTCICMYVSVHVCVCVHVSVLNVYLFLYVCAWLCVTTSWTRSCDPNSVKGDSELCPLWTRYTGDSKTDSWDDP